MVHFVGGANLRPSGEKIAAKLQTILKETSMPSPWGMFHLFSAVWCVIRSSAGLLLVTQTWEWKHASHKKSDRPDQKNFVWRGRHQRDETQTVWVKRKNSQLEKRLHESGRRYAPGGEEPRPWTTTNVLKCRRGMSSVPASAVIWNQERLKAWLHTSSSPNPDFF